VTTARALHKTLTDAQGATYTAGEYYAVVALTMHNGAYATAYMAGSSMPDYWFADSQRRLLPDSAAGVQQAARDTYGRIGRPFSIEGGATVYVVQVYDIHADSTMMRYCDWDYYPLCALGTP
jgi:hypothetical protein